jgi:predicted Zn-dependent protease
MKRALLICGLIFLIIGCAPQRQSPVRDYRSVHGPFITYAPETFVKKDSGETGLHIAGENWYALINLSGFEDMEQRFTSPTQFLIVKGHDPIIVSAFAGQFEGVTDNTSCHNAWEPKGKAEFRGKTVSIIDSPIRKSIFFRPFHEGYCFNFHVSYDPGSREQEKRVGEILDSIQFIDARMPRATLHKIIYIADKRLKFEIPDHWNLSFRTEEVHLPTIALTSGRESDFKMALSPTAGFGSPPASLEQAKKRTEEFMARAATFAVSPPVLQEYRRDDAVIFYFDAVDKRHDPGNPKDYPFLRQGHALIKGAVLYFSIFSREAGSSDAAKALELVSKARILHLPETANSKLPPSLAESRDKVDRLLASKDPVLIRRNIHDAFSLIDRYIESHNEDEAFRYLDVALKHQPWNLSYQMLYAEMLAKRGEMGRTHQICKTVLEYSEKDALIDRAHYLLGAPALPEVPPFSSIPSLLAGTREPAVVLLALGMTDQCVLTDLQRALEEKLKIPVRLYEVEATLPPFKRDPAQTVIDTLRIKYIALVDKDPRFLKFLASKGITREDLNRRAVLLQVLQEATQGSGDEKAKEMYHKIKELSEQEQQWDIQDLLDLVKRSASPYRNDNLYFLGVANLDAFADKSNFIFGIAENNSQHGVITYRRFSADFNRETPNRKKLVERALKQSLSSLGFMLGIERCSSPVCARAYPHTLSEHDAKSPDLCDACRKGFERALGGRLEQDKRP